MLKTDYFTFHLVDGEKIKVPLDVYWIRFDLRAREDCVTRFHDRIMAAGGWHRPVTNLKEQHAVIPVTDEGINLGIDMLEVMRPSVIGKKNSECSLYLDFLNRDEQSVMTMDKEFARRAMEDHEESVSHTPGVVRPDDVKRLRSLSRVRMFTRKTVKTMHNAVSELRKNMYLAAQKWPLAIICEEAAPTLLEKIERENAKARCAKRKSRMISSVRHGLRFIQEATDRERRDAICALAREVARAPRPVRDGLIRMYLGVIGEVEAIFGKSISST